MANASKNYEQDYRQSTRLSRSPLLLTPELGLRESGEGSLALIEGDHAMRRGNQFTSILRLPTATFAWPRLVPASKMAGPPNLYIDYHDRAPNLDWHNRLDELRVSLKSTRAATRILDHQFSVLSAKEEPAQETPPMRSPHDEEVSRSPDLRSSASRHSLSPSPERDPRQLAASPLRAESPLSSEDDEPSGEDELDEEKGGSSSRPFKWRHHARRVQDSEGKFSYICIWGESEGQHVCGYQTKTQLVKRHIEDTHLGIKRHKCHVCKKSFPQKNQRDVHVNTHTKEKPYDCLFDGCNESFGDPSRRLRHHRRVHDYQPKTYKKRFKSSNAVKHAGRSRRRILWL